MTERNWLCNHMKNSQKLPISHSCTQLNKTHFFPVSIVKGVIRIYRRDYCRSFIWQEKYSCRTYFLKHLIFALKKKILIWLTACIFNWCNNEVSAFNQCLLVMFLSLKQQSNLFMISFEMLTNQMTWLSSSVNCLKFYNVSCRFSWLLRSRTNINKIYV